MDWNKFLRLGLVCGLLITGSSFAPAYAEAGCSTATFAFDSCTGAQANSSSVDVWGNRTTPGETAPNGDASSGSGAVPAGWWSAPEVPFSLFPQRANNINSYCDLVAFFGGNLCPVAPQPAPAPAPAAPVTLRDLASFVPEQPSLSLHPNGWTVIGVETNFIAGTSQHVVAGKLFGSVAEVRFTPQDFDWNYADGSGTTTSTPGATWASLGVKEFSRTATSHRYNALGTFTPNVTVRFGVEYRVGGGAWIPVRGQVSASAPSSTVTVYSADTVLVTGACTPGRPAPGC